MSRSRKKHYGSTFASGSDKPWRKQWHSAMRAKERDLLISQMKNPEVDFIFPVPNEVGNLWTAPSDGGSHWMYHDFNHYYYNSLHPRWIRSWMKEEIPTREEVWKDWVKFIGK